MLEGSQLLGLSDMLRELDSDPADHKERVRLAEEQELMPMPRGTVSAQCCHQIDRVTGCGRAIPVRDLPHPRGVFPSPLDPRRSSK